MSRSGLATRSNMCSNTVMRWSGQQVLDDGVGAELALPGLRGLLRTVRVPEFAGMTFHEVEAKSALNRVPGDSPVPFRWTVNPYRGCGHACVYCLDGATRVLLADGRTRPIADLRPGDAVRGHRGGRRGSPPVRGHGGPRTLVDAQTRAPGHPRGRHRARRQRRPPLPDRPRMAARGAGMVPGRAPAPAAPGRRPARPGCAARSSGPHGFVPRGLPARPRPRRHGGAAAGARRPDRPRLPVRPAGARSARPGPPPARHRVQWRGPLPARRRSLRGSHVLRLRGGGSGARRRSPPRRSRRRRRSRGHGRAGPRRAGPGRRRISPQIRRGTVARARARRGRPAPARP